MRSLYEFLKRKDSQEAISDYCSQQQIEWKYIPERSPHFGGLWESAVKCVKTRLRKTIGSTKLDYKELVTVLTQIEACHNSRPLAPMTTTDGEGVEALTPGHFLIGKPLCALPEQPRFVKNPSVLRRWQLCQEQFWQKWSNEYLNSLRKFYRHYPKCNISPGDVVLLQEDGISVGRWPLGRVQHTYPGSDGLVRAVDVKTVKVTYRRPIVKLAPLFAYPD